MASESSRSEILEIVNQFPGRTSLKAYEPGNSWLWHDCVAQRALSAL